MGPRETQSHQLPRSRRIHPPRVPQGMGVVNVEDRRSRMENRYVPTSPERQRRACIRRYAMKVQAGSPKWIVSRLIVAAVLMVLFLKSGGAQDKDKPAATDKAPAPP